MQLATVLIYLLQNGFADFNLKREQDLCFKAIDDSHHSILQPNVVKVQLSCGKFENEMLFVCLQW